jgi:hypothetical protein
MEYKIVHLNVQRDGAIGTVQMLSKGWRIHTVLNHSGNLISGMQLHVLLEKESEVR